MEFFDCHSLAYVNLFFSPFDLRTCLFFSRSVIATTFVLFFILLLFLRLLLLPLPIPVPCSLFLSVRSLIAINRCTSVFASFPGPEAQISFKFFIQKISNLSFLVSSSSLFFVCSLNFSPLFQNSLPHTQKLFQSLLYRVCVSFKAFGQDTRLPVAGLPCLQVASTKSRLFLERKLYTRAERFHPFLKLSKLDSLPLKKQFMLQNFVDYHQESKGERASGRTNGRAKDVVRLGWETICCSQALF